jgi:mitogen-activated protein kinase organizer 1
MLKPVRTLSSHEGAVHVVRYNASGQYCLSGGQDKEVHLFNPTTGNKIKAYLAHGMPTPLKSFNKG